MISSIKELFKVPARPEDPGIPITSGDSQQRELRDLSLRKYENEISMWGVDVQVFWTRWIAVATVLLVVATIISLL